MSFGLRQEDIEYIIKTLSKFNEIERAVVFGSRAKGNFKPGSDIDIAIVGKEINFDTLSRLHALIEEYSPLPYLIDIVDYTHYSTKN